MKRLHYLSGIVITVFIAFHLFNHVCSIFGADVHIEVMNSLRPFYRNVLIEPILLSAVIAQIFSEYTLFKNRRKIAITTIDKLHIWSGLYLAIFLLIHVSAVLTGRFFFNLDTNFYFGVAGVNSFPFNLFFIPYYALAIISFFAHIACIHHIKMKQTIFGLTPINQSKAILIFSICLTILIFYGLTNHFEGVKIPSTYNILIGK